MTNFVILLRRIRTLLWTALSIVIILCAVLVGLGELLMPYSANYQPRLENWLSEEFGRPVEIESFTGEWKAFGPQLALKGLKLPAIEGEADAAVIGQAVIDIKPFNALIPSKALYNFRVVGADFRLVHREDGTFEFFGLGVKPGKGQSESGSALKHLASISEVILEDSGLKYDDEVHDIHLDLRAINGRLQAEGDEILAEIGFRLAHGAEGVSGELEATAHLSVDDDQHPVSARWQLSGQELMLDQLREGLPDSAWFPQQGRINTEVWGEWDHENQHFIRGVADLRQARLVTDELDRSIERINTRFQWHFSDLDDWRLDLSDFKYKDGEASWSVNSLGVGRRMPQGVGLWISADELPVNTPVAIARDVVRALGKDWPRYLPGSGIGVVRDLEVVLNRNMKLGTATGRFSEGSVGDWDIWPDIANVDGRLEFGPGNGRLILDGKNVVVEWPRMFAAPLTVDMPSCIVAFTWGPEKGKYQVDLPECRVENEFVSARGEMHFRSNTGKPAVDVNVYADRLDVSFAGDYWPRDLLKETAITWLENGLIGGQLESGRLQIHGDIDHWPFDGGEGRFEAIAQVRDADIAYFEGWPQARAVDGIAHFVNAGMDIQGISENIGGVALQDVRVRIEDFREPELQVEYRSQGDLDGLIGFIRQSPVQARVGTDLSRFAFEGPATTSGLLSVPLGQGREGIVLSGELQLPGNTFSDPDLGFSLDDISGLVAYNQGGFEGTGLAAQYLGVPANLSIRAGSGISEGSQTDPVATGKFEARLSGNFEVTDLLPQQLVESWSPLSRIVGTSQWEVTLTAGGGEAANFRMASDLKGVAIDLPAPLDKPVAERWPFEIGIPLVGDQRELRIDLEDRLVARVAVGAELTAPKSIAVRVGQGEAELPSSGLLTIGGDSDIVDLDGWIALVVEQARRGKGLGGMTLQSGTVNAGQIRLLDRSFDEVKMAFSVDTGTLTADFDAETIDGKVTFVGIGSGSQSLSAEFERLVLDEPLTSGMKMDVNPAQLPALHLYAKSFRYGRVEMGETRIEAYPKAEGFHFESVEAESPNMSVRASGDWSLVDGSHRSNFDINMASESLGDFLRHLDISSAMEGGQTLVHFGVWWNGSPGQFRLARLNGKVDFSVNTGVISNASPGSGRLLGLLSVQALPRRLALDFRDVFDSGFAFDEANGTFTMLNGSARTDDVTLKSSAANISFSGTTDLVGRQYDQLITVRPGLGNTLPVIGAIAGGPGGAAAGLALQGLLHEELGEASQVQYTLTGAWDKPQIEPVLKTRNDG